MTRTSTTAWILRSLVAGLVAAVTVELYLFAVGLASWPGVYQWVASALVGQTAFTAVEYAWLGVAVHVAISLGWGLVFGAATRRWPGVLTRPVTSGLVYGVVVLVAMQMALWIDGLWTPPSTGVVLHYLIDHTVFFGVPLALTLRRLAARTARSRAAAGAPPTPAHPAEPVTPR